MMENVCETESEYYQRALQLALDSQQLLISKQKLSHALKEFWPRSDQDQSNEFFETLKKI